MHRQGGAARISLFDIDVVSNTYRKGGKRSAEAKAKENFGDALKFFTEYAQSHEIGSVLDVGCGAGEVTNAVRQAIGRDDILFVGVDAAQKQIRNARKDYSRIKNMTFAVAGGDALPFADRAFGAVYENSALCWSLAPAAFIAEMLRVSDGIVSFRANVRPNGGQSYACGFELVEKVGSRIKLTFNPADYGLTEFVPNFLYQTPTENVYQYPIWLQKVAWITDDQLSRLVARGDIEILLDKTHQTQDLTAVRVNEVNGPPTRDDRFFAEMVTSRHIVARTA